MLPLKITTVQVVAPPSFATGPLCSPAAAVAPSCATGVRDFDCYRASGFDLFLNPDREISAGYHNTRRSGVALDGHATAKIGSLLRAIRTDSLGVGQCWGHTFFLCACRPYTTHVISTGFRYMTSLGNTLSFEWSG